MLTHLRPAYDRLLKVGISTDTVGSRYAVNTPIDTQQLLNDEPLKNVVVRLRSILEIRVYWLGVTIKELEQLIEEIQDEIDRLSN